MDNCATLNFASYHRIFLKNCTTEEHEIFLHKVSIWVNIQKKFIFLGGTVLEKNAMLTASHHRISLENCVTEEHEIFFI